MTFAKLPPLFKTLTNAAPATIFETVSRLRVPANAICGNSTFATSQNAAPARTSRKATSQSAAPARKTRRACIDSLPKYCACHAKHENDLTFCDLGPPKRAFRARLPPLFILWKTGWCRSACVPPNREKLTSWRRVGDESATTRRRRGSKTKRTQVQPQTPTINGNPSLRIREKTQISHDQTLWSAWHFMVASKSASDGGLRQGLVVPTVRSDVIRYSDSLIGILIKRINYIQI